MNAATLEPAGCAPPTPFRRLYFAGMGAAYKLAQRAERRRARRRALRPPLAPAASLADAWGALRIARDLPAAWAPPPALAAAAADLRAGRFCLYRTRYEKGPRFDWWTDPSTGWRFDSATDLGTGRGDIKQVWKLSCAHHLLPAAALAAATDSEETAAAVLRELDDWIAANPVGEGPNWLSPTEVALRVASWSLILLLLRDAVGRAEPAFQDRLLRSLTAHGNFVWTRLEDLGLRCNHYVANLAGLHVLTLTFGGLVGAGPLRRRSATLLAQAARDQTGRDGVHREFSSHYHRLVAELFLLPASLARAAGCDDFQPDYHARVRAMLRVLALLAGDGGVLPQIGDNDSEVVACVGLDDTPRPRDIRPFLRGAQAGLDAAPAAGRLSLRLVLALLGADGDGAAERRPEGWTVFSSAGWHAWRGGDTELLALCGPVGSVGIGAHDHAHVNQVLLNAGGQEFIVDPGTGCYTADPRVRNRFRSAAVHSCALAGIEPAGWRPDEAGLFHLRSVWRAKAALDADGSLRMRARYGGCEHLRRVRPSPDGAAIAVEDRFNRVLPGAAVQWVLHPEVRVLACDGALCRLGRGGRVVTLVTDAGNWCVAPAPYSEHFGHVGETLAVRVPLARPCCRTTLQVSRA
jgi:hypothetical protein